MPEEPPSLKLPPSHKTVADKSAVKMMENEQFFKAVLNLLEVT
jgi:hypothetical protein